jgi:hypothetical protein
MHRIAIENKVEADQVEMYFYNQDFE